MNVPSRDVWLAQHPYLQPIADLHVVIDAAVAAVASPVAVVPQWHAYEPDFAEGIPLLRSPAIVIDWNPPAQVLRLVVERLARGALPGSLSDQHRVLAQELDGDPDAPHRAIAALLEPGAFTTSNPGLLQFLGWEILSRYLSAVVSAFDRWRVEERWLRPYCPCCGAAPAMAQLVGTDPGRMRMLSCARCHTRWRYRRTACPFCDTGDDHRVAVLAVDGEGGLRIDYCESCRGYLKTYVGEGAEPLLLADWTSLHLDAVARQNGLQRRGTSMYQV